MNTKGLILCQEKSRFFWEKALASFFRFSRERWRQGGWQSHAFVYVYMYIYLHVRNGKLFVIILNYCLAVDACLS